jgi:hypothetical protein
VTKCHWNQYWQSDEARPCDLSIQSVFDLQAPSSSFTDEPFDISLGYGWHLTIRRK